MLNDDKLYDVHSVLEDMVNDLGDEAAIDVLLEALRNINFNDPDKAIEYLTKSL